MPGKSPTQRIEELTERLRTVESALERHQDATEFQFEEVNRYEGVHQETEAELWDKVSDLTAKNATLEERCRNLEKNADRGWQMWLAALGFGFGLISLFITIALQLKK